MNDAREVSRPVEPSLPLDPGERLTKDRRKDRLLRFKAVMARTGLSTSTINRREAAGSFPKRQVIGARCVAWYESDVDDFVADPLGYRSA